MKVTSTRPALWDAHARSIDAGAAERFVRIAPEAEFAHDAFAEPNALRRAAKELGLSIVEEP